jgi:hypothetical protein
VLSAKERFQFYDTGHVGRLKNQKRSRNPNEKCGECAAAIAQL